MRRVRIVHRQIGKPWSGGSLPADLAVGQPFASHQHDIGTPYLPLGRGLFADSLFKVFAFGVSQFDFSALGPGICNTSEKVMGTRCLFSTNQKILSYLSNYLVVMALVSSRTQLRSL